MKISLYKFIILSSCFLFLFSENCFSAGTLVIEAVGDNVALYEDYAFSQALSKGYLVQVILDRNGDGLNSIEFSGNVYPSEDDILLPVLSGSNTFRIGDGLPPFAEQGQFSVNMSLDNEDPDPNYTGYKVYIRFWNSPEPGTGSLYGEAGPFILEGSLKPQVFNILQNGSLYTDKELQ